MAQMTRMRLGEGGMRLADPFFLAMSVVMQTCRSVGTLSVRLDEAKAAACT